MEKLKNDSESSKSLLDGLIPKLILLLLSPFFVLAAWCSLFGLYLISAEYVALLLQPPAFPNAIEVSTYPRNGTDSLGKAWIYCTDVTLEELVTYFEGYVGELNRIENGQRVSYGKGFTHTNPIILLLTWFGGASDPPSLYLHIQSDDSGQCVTRYEISISYIAP